MNPTRSLRPPCTAGGGRRRQRRDPLLDLCGPSRGATRPARSDPPASRHAPVRNCTEECRPSACQSGRRFGQIARLGHFPLLVHHPHSAPCAACARRGAACRGKRLHQFAGTGGIGLFDMGGLVVVAAAHQAVDPPDRAARRISGAASAARASASFAPRLSPSPRIWARRKFRIHMGAIAAR